jgi:hypothetical protein
MAFLRIQRTNRWWGSRLPVFIYIDGEKKGEILPPAPGEPVNFHLPRAGTYLVSFEIDGCRSAVYPTPYIAEDEFQTLEVILPEHPGLSAIFDRNNFGHLSPRSSAISKWK